MGRSFSFWLGLQSVPNYEYKANHGYSVTGPSQVFVIFLHFLKKLVGTYRLGQPITQASEHHIPDQGTKSGEQSELPYVHP